MKLQLKEPAEVFQFGQDSWPTWWNRLVDNGIVKPIGGSNAMLRESPNSRTYRMIIPGDYVVRISDGTIIVFASLEDMQGIFEEVPEERKSDPVTQALKSLYPNKQTTSKEHANPCVPYAELYDLLVEKTHLQLECRTTRMILESVKGHLKHWMSGGSEISSVDKLQNDEAQKILDTIEHHEIMIQSKIKE